MRLEGRDTHLSLKKKGEVLLLCQRGVPVTEVSLREWEVVKDRYTHFKPDSIYVPTGEEFCYLFTKQNRVYLLSERGTIVSVPIGIYEHKFRVIPAEVRGILGRGPVTTAERY